jgi:hypothetical protein
MVSGDWANLNVGSIPPYKWRKTYSIRVLRETGHLVGEAAIGGSCRFFSEWMPAWHWVQSQWFGLSSRPEY